MKLYAADLFAGAGGASTGLQLAAKAAGVGLDLVAVNHWPAAVQTHAVNHPEARHLCEAIERVDPRDAVPGGRLHLLLAGPECTFFSTARGGRPIDDQRRSSAWTVLRWLELLRVDHLLLENVPEFAAWGPLDADHKRPLKSKRGAIFRQYVAAIEAMNYRVEWLILNAADFGEATTRRRLFLQARRGRGQIVWPEPTHSRRGEGTLLRHTRPWRPAREVIDWSLPSKSIFARKRPLSKNTLRRIEAGLKRFGGAPFVLGQQSGSVPRATSEPMPTIATDGAIGVAQPFVLQITHGGREHSTARPLPTITGGNRGDMALVEPFLVPFYGERRGQEPRTHAVSEPVPTIPASGDGKFGLVEPFVVEYHSERKGEPPRVRSVNDPLPTATTENRFGLVEPFTLPHNSNGAQLARPVTEPVATITTRDRFGLVIPEGMDIRFRMLQPHELAAAMGFPADYRFVGTKGDTIRMIGNAWSCRIATALCAAILERWQPARASREEATA